MSEEYGKYTIDFIKAISGEDEEGFEAAIPAGAALVHIERLQSELIEARKLIAKLRHLKLAHYNDFIQAFGEYDGWREEMGYDDD